MRLDLPDGLKRLEIGISPGELLADATYSAGKVLQELERRVAQGRWEKRGRFRLARPSELRFNLVRLS